MPLPNQKIRRYKIVTGIGYVIVGLSAAAFIPVNVRQLQAATAAGLDSTNQTVSLVLNVIVSLVGLYGVVLLIRAASHQPAPTAEDHPA